jgi:putative transposase
MNSAPPGPDARCADRTVIRQIYEADTLREARSALWHEGNSGAPAPVPRQYSAGNQMLELSARIRRRSRLDDCRAAPPASAPALPRWRPSSARPRERGLAPSARRLQAHGDTAPTPPDGSVLLDRAGQSVVRVETAPSDRDPDTVPRWRDLVPLDFFMVPCRPARALRSRRIRSPSPTSRPFQNIPTVHWASRQIVGAFPDDSAPVYLLRDRDAVYGDVFRQRVTGMGIGEVLTAPYSPWQNAFAERLIGSIPRECLDHVVVLGERHLRRLLTVYFAHYHRARTHLSLDKVAPVGRPIEPPELGAIIPVPEVGARGLP